MLWVFLMIGCLVSPAAAVDFWDITVVDSAGYVGRQTSLTILPSGQPAISYFDFTNEDLKYAWYDGSTWQTTTVDSVGNVGWYTSLAILPSGQSAISYWDFTNTDLKYAWYDGNVWQSTIVDSNGQVGSYTSLVVLPSGYSAISYLDSTNGDLKYAWYDGSTWETATVDSTGWVGQHTSMAILPSGYPAISYYDATNKDLKYAWYDGSAWETTTVDSTGIVGVSTSLAILPSGYPAISYYDATNKDLKYAWYDGSTWQTATVDSTKSADVSPSLAILPSGQPAISYFDFTNEDLKYAWYDGSTWQITTVDSTGSVGWYSSMAILPSGQPAISYHDLTNDDLKYAWLLNVGYAPVALTVNYTATAHTDLGGTTVVIDGPAYNEGMEPSICGEPWVQSSVELVTTDKGHLRGWMALAGQDGRFCMDELYCEVCWGISCRDANGLLSGTIVVGTSESYPTSSELDLDLRVLVGGDPGDAEYYHLKLWRGASLIAQIDPCAPAPIVVPVEAGETLTFELCASEEDWYDDIFQESYNRGFDFWFIIRGLANFDGIGTVDFRDYGIFALRWLDVGCGDPNWCGKTDLDKSGDVNWPDLKIFTDHWLE